MKMYVCCPICSKTLIQAETIKNGIIKCESCHKRIIVEIDKGKVTVVPLEVENKKDTRRHSRRFFIFGHSPCLLAVSNAHV